MAITTKAKPTSLYFTADNNYAHREFNCPWCKSRLFDVGNGQIVTMTDNSGPATSEFYLEIKCRNSQCQAVWRVYPPVPEKEFEPVIRVNGKVLVP